MRGIALRCSVALLLLVLAGCSDGDPGDAARQARVEDAFQRGFTQVSEDYRTSMAKVQGEGRAALESQDRERVLAVYRAIAAATTTADKRFSKLTPPDRVAGDFEELLANLAEQRKALKGVVTAVKANRSGSLTEGLQQFSTLLGEFGSIQKSITTALAQE